MVTKLWFSQDMIRCGMLVDFMIFTGAGIWSICFRLGYHRKSYKKIMQLVHHIFEESYCIQNDARVVMVINFLTAI